MSGVASSGCSSLPSELATSRRICPGTGKTLEKNTRSGGGSATAAAARSENVSAHSFIAAPALSSCSGGRASAYYEPIRYRWTTPRVLGRKGRRGVHIADEVF